MNYSPILRKLYDYTFFFDSVFIQLCLVETKIIMKNTVRKYLDLLKHSQLKNAFEENFLSHPNYPSLYAITDSLSLLGVDNIAAQVPKDQFFDLPPFFLSFLNNEFVLVERKENEVHLVNEDFQKQIVKTETFLNDWGGVVLAVEENQNVDLVQFENNNWKYLLLIVLSFVIYYFNNHLTVSVVSFLGFALSIIGFVIGLLIVEEKFGNIDNPIVSKLCSFSEHTSCASVVKYSSNIFPKWIDFSDLPIIFFGTAISAQLLHQEAIYLVSLLSVISLPIVGYSIWLQKTKVKKWCALCLSVSGIILLLSSIQLLTPKDYIFKNQLYFFVIGLVVLGVWFIVRHFLSNATELKKENMDLKKFKRNFALLKTLLKPVAKYEQLDLMNGILIGEKDATINLTLLLSPSCSHCHTAFKEALDLYKQFNQKIGIKIVFNVNPKNIINTYLEVVFTLLHINANQNENVLKALSDWHLDRMPMENWLLKWNHATDDFEVEHQQLLQQYEWCQNNNFNYTPVRLINGSLYPSEYAIQDLQYFISEFEELQ